MGVIGLMNFAALDLNLLRVFDAMAIELNTTRAGERVGLSQPAVSSALGRLRHILGDELFVREGNRMVPTERALALREPVRAALRQMEDALAAVARFDPAIGHADLPHQRLGLFLHPADATARRRGDARSAGRDAADGRPSQRRGGALAGRGRYRSRGRPGRRFNSPTIVDARLEVPDWVCSRKLLESFVVSVVTKRHPVLEKAGIKPGHRIPAEVFCDIPQVLMSMDGSKVGTIDPVFAERGLQRRIALTVPHFQAVALAIAEPGLLGNLPIHFARAVAPALGLELYLPPYDPPITDVMLFWHRRVDAHAANAWLRDHIAKALDLGPSR